MSLYQLIHSSILLVLQPTKAYCLCYLCFFITILPRLQQFIAWHLSIWLSNQMFMEWSLLLKVAWRNSSDPSGYLSVPPSWLWGRSCNTHLQDPISLVMCFWCEHLSFLYCVIYLMVLLVCYCICGVQHDFALLFITLVLMVSLVV